MPNTEPKKLLQVAVGVVKDADGNILIALRDSALHQGGLWEFPGGKLESGETAEQALVRELKEELNVTVQTAKPLITINHHYPDKSVQLHVFLVEQFFGPVQSCEGQPFAWVAVADLCNYPFPKANRAIINALKLPDCYAILDDSCAELLPKLQQMLASGIKLIQARLKLSSCADVQAFMDQAVALCRQQQALLLINSAVANHNGLNADGLHLTSRDLMALNARPEAIQWLAASCHNGQELQHAQRVGVD
ncbi:MAG: Nudix family hydrolase, partial [Methylococcales bacterium]